MLWQFKYSWKKWLGTLFVFTAAGIVLGFTFIGSFSTINAHLNNGRFNPVQFFAIPAIFGVITIILIINGVTRLLINSFSKDYQLWAVLGANPNQLSELVSGQMMLISLIGGTIGYLLSYPLTSSLYSWSCSTPGMKSFPHVTMYLSPQSFVFTILSVGILTVIVSFGDARRIFVGKQKHFFKFQKIRKQGMSPVRYLFSFAGLLGLIYLYSLFFQNPVQVQSMFSGKDDSLVGTYSNLFLLLTIVAIIAFSLLAPLILPFIVRLLFKITSHNHLKTFTTAYYNVLSKRSFLKSVIVPLFILILFTSYVTYLSIDLANVSSRRDSSELIAAFTLFLGAPFIIVLANIISIAIISSSQRNESIYQLQILGFSFTDLLSEKCLEALLYAGVIFFVGIVNNTFLFEAILRAAQNTGVTVKDNWFSIIYWPGVISIIAFLFIVIIDIAHIYRISTRNEVPEVIE